MRRRAGLSRKPFQPRPVGSRCPPVDDGARAAVAHLVAPLDDPFDRPVGMADADCCGPRRTAGRQRPAIPVRQSEAAEAAAGLIAILRTAARRAFRASPTLAALRALTTSALGTMSAGISASRAAATSSRSASGVAVTCSSRRPCEIGAVARYRQANAQGQDQSGRSDRQFQDEVSSSHRRLPGKIPTGRPDMRGSYGTQNPKPRHKAGTVKAAAERQRRLACRLTGSCADHSIAVLPSRLHARG